MRLLAAVEVVSVHMGDVGLRVGGPGAHGVPALDAVTPSTRLARRDAVRNGPRIEQETTHVIVRWTRVASMA